MSEHSAAAQGHTPPVNGVSEAPQLKPPSSYSRVPHPHHFLILKRGPAMVWIFS